MVADSKLQFSADPKKTILAGKVALWNRNCLKLVTKTHPSLYSPWTGNIFFLLFLLLCLGDFDCLHFSPLYMITESISWMATPVTSYRFHKELPCSFRYGRWLSVLTLCWVLRLHLYSITEYLIWTVLPFLWPKDTEVFFFFFFF